MQNLLVTALGIFFSCDMQDLGASLVAQSVKNPPARQETSGSLAQKDPLEKEVATHSSILAWEIPWTEEPSGLQRKALQELDTT